MTATGPDVGTRAPRWAGWAAIGFAVLFVLGTLLLDTPNGDASVSEWQDYFADSGNRVMVVLHGYAWALAGIAFIVFLSAIRERLRVAGDWIGSLAYATGMIFAVIVLFAAGVTSAVAAGIEFGDVPTEGAGEFARNFESIAYSTLLVGGMFAAGVFVLTAAIALRRGGSIPAWVAVLGYIFSVIIFVLGVFFLPLALLVLWMLIVGIVLLVSGRATASVTTTA